jgi:hypothetical protein
MYPPALVKLSFLILTAEQVKDCGVFGTILGS